MKQSFNFPCARTCVVAVLPTMCLQCVSAVAGAILVLVMARSGVGQEPQTADTEDHHYFSKTEHAHEAEWGYDGRIGPEFWGMLNPEYRLASEGMRQSPVDIPLSRSVVRDLPPLEFDYQEERLTVVNNGHAIQHNEEPGSFLHVGDDVYALEQFHVHLPSEHTIDGEHTDMEIHFVHKSETGEVAVVAVLVNAGSENPVDVPPIRVSAEVGEETVAFDGHRNPAELIPSDRAYVTYSGSFTTPPCTEGVRWFVMTTPIEARSQSLEELRRTTGGNNRPVQRLFGREVFVRRNLVRDE
jgi:carbonic anhydrase